MEARQEFHTTGPFFKHWLRSSPKHDAADVNHHEPGNTRTQLKADDHCLKSHLSGSMNRMPATYMKNVSKKMRTKINTANGLSVISCNLGEVDATGGIQGDHTPASAIHDVDMPDSLASYVSDHSDHCSRLSTLCKPRAP